MRQLKQRSLDARALIEALIEAGVEFRRTAGGAWWAWGLNGERVEADLRELFLNANERAVAGALAEIEAKAKRRAA